MTSWEEIKFLQKPWIKKTAWVLANLSTLGSITLGIIGLVYTFIDPEGYAFWFAKILGICSILDFADGKLARISGSKKLAIDIDTIVDSIVFGLLPGVYLGYRVSKWSIIAGIATGLIYTGTAWYRLYRYTKRDPIDVLYFQGLPSPFAAMVISCIVIFEGTPEWAVAMSTVIVAGFMVSVIPFPSFKGVPSKFDLFWIISTTIFFLAFVTFPFNWMIYPTYFIAILMIIYLIAGPSYALKLEKARKQK
ncbi:MAG: CDP-alcohol phosphatidyltransferase family protein [Candidatus Heimdallarchaeaceae archaeon]